MSTTKLTKLEIASTQLRIAVSLLVTGEDPIAAMTLADTADGILQSLVVIAGKKPFVDYMRVQSTPVNAKGRRPGQTKIDVQNAVAIRAIRHMADSSADFVVADVEQCAAGALAKAIANYRQLVRTKPAFVEMFYVWAEGSVERTTISDAYEDPARAQPRRRRSDVRQ